MQTPRAPPQMTTSAKALSLKSTQTSLVTPIAADATSVLGRKGAVGALPLEILSPTVSRCQAELARRGDALVLTSRGAHPTALVRGGAVIRVDRGDSADVRVGDTIVLATARILRASAAGAPPAFDGGDEAFTVVEDGLADLGSALAEIARLRAALAAAEAPGAAAEAPGAAGEAPGAAAGEPEPAGAPEEPAEAPAEEMELEPPGDEDRLAANRAIVAAAADGAAPGAAAAAAARRVLGDLPAAAADAWPVAVARAGAYVAETDAVRARVALRCGRLLAARTAAAAAAPPTAAAAAAEAAAAALREAWARFEVPAGYAPRQACVDAAKARAARAAAERRAYLAVWTTAVEGAAEAAAASYLVEAPAGAVCECWRAGPPARRDFGAFGSAVTAQLAASYDDGDADVAAARVGAVARAVADVWNDPAKRALVGGAVGDAAWLDEANVAGRTFFLGGFRACVDELLGRAATLARAYADAERIAEDLGADGSGLGYLLGVFSRRVAGTASDQDRTRAASWEARRDGTRSDDARPADLSRRAPSTSLEPGARALLDVANGEGAAARRLLGADALHFSFLAPCARLAEKKGDAVTAAAFCAAGLLRCLAAPETEPEDTAIFAVGDHVERFEADRGWLPGSYVVGVGAEACDVVAEDEASGELVPKARLRHSDGNGPSDGFAPGVPSRLDELHRVAERFFRQAKLAAAAAAPMDADDGAPMDTDDAAPPLLRPFVEGRADADAVAAVAVSACGGDAHLLASIAAVAGRAESPDAARVLGVAALHAVASRLCTARRPSARPLLARSIAEVRGRDAAAAGDVDFALAGAVELPATARPGWNDPNFVSCASRAVEALAGSLDGDAAAAAAVARAVALASPRPLSAAALGDVLDGRGRAALALRVFAAALERCPAPGLSRDAAADAAYGDAARPVADELVDFLRADVDDGAARSRACGALAARALAEVAAGLPDARRCVADPKTLALDVAYGDSPGELLCAFAAALLWARREPPRLSDDAWGAAVAAAARAVNCPAVDGPAVAALLERAAKHAIKAPTLGLCGAPPGGYSTSTRQLIRAAFTTGSGRHRRHHAAQYRTVATLKPVAALVASAAAAPPAVAALGAAAARLRDVGVAFGAGDARAPPPTAASAALRRRVGAALVDAATGDVVDGGVQQLVGLAKSRLATTATPSAADKLRHGATWSAYSAANVRDQGHAIRGLAEAYAVARAFGRSNVCDHVRAVVADSPKLMDATKAADLAAPPPVRTPLPEWAGWPHGGPWVGFLDAEAEAPAPAADDDVEAWIARVAAPGLRDALVASARDEGVDAEALASMGADDVAAVFPALAAAPLDELLEPFAAWRADADERRDRPPPLAAGDAVEARFKGGGAWFPGVVAAVHAPRTQFREPTYDVDYDDGDAERGVKADLVRRPPARESTGELGRRGRTSELSRPRRLMFGRCLVSRRVFEAPRKRARSNERTSKSGRRSGFWTTPVLSSSSRRSGSRAGGRRASSRGSPASWPAPSPP